MRRWLERAMVGIKLEVDEDVGKVFFVKDRHDFRANPRAGLKKIEVWAEVLRARYALVWWCRQACEFAWQRREIHRRSCE